MGGDGGQGLPDTRRQLLRPQPCPEHRPVSWTLRVEGPGVERPLELSYEELSGMPQASIVRALECAGNGRAYFGEVQGRQPEGTPWRLGAIGVAEWTGVLLGEVLERAGLKASASSVMLAEAWMR